MIEEPVVILSPVEQIGIVVTDVDKATEYLAATFDWGPFKIREVELNGVTYGSQTGDCRLKMAFARSGDVEIGVDPGSGGGNPSF